MRELRNSGLRFIAAVGQVIAELQPGDAQARLGSLPGSGGTGPTADGPVTPAGLPATAATALRVMAAWAVAEHGASTLGDLLTLAPGVTDLPPDVARSWDASASSVSRPWPGAAVPDGDLPQLAWDLLDELEERRRLILASGTFGPVRRTYDSLAAEPGVGRKRVRQLETRRCCSWRAASAARPGDARAAAIPGAPPWRGQMLSWLADQPT